MSQAVLVTLIALQVMIGPAQSGWASQYAPGVMGRTVKVRQAGQTYHDLPEALPQVDGYAAVRWCGDIGRLLLVRPEGGDWELFLAADCAGPQLREDGTTGGDWMDRSGVILEVGYPTAERWTSIGRGKRESK